MKNENGIAVLSSNDEQIVEFKWQGKVIEIFLYNYISTPEGFFLWENLDESVLKVATELYNTKLLAKLETSLAA